MKEGVFSLHALRVFLKGLSRVEEALVVLLFVPLLGLGIAQVSLRNLFGIGSGFADEAIRHAVVWVGFFGAGLATHRRHHITVDVFSKSVPKSLQGTLLRLRSLISLLISLALFWAAYRFFVMEYRSGEFSFSLGLPYWFLTLPILWFFISSTLRYLVGVFSPHTEAKVGGSL
jgi:TRAP-type C4-dicarboxylate transport system permease small subunit